MIKTSRTIIEDLFEKPSIQKTKKLENTLDF